MALAHNRDVGVRWILCWRENRFCTYLHAISGLSPLASKFYFGSGTVADAPADLVVHPAIRISGALPGTIAESCSTANDLMLVHQQLLRSNHRRESDAVFCWRLHSF